MQIARARNQRGVVTMRPTHARGESKAVQRSVDDCVTEKEIIKVALSAGCTH